MTPSSRGSMKTSRIELYLWINSHEYALSRLPTNCDDIRAVWQLDGMESGEPYSVILYRRGHQTECTCKDWSYRRQQRMQVCKHIAALIQIGLIPHKDKVWSKV